MYKTYSQILSEPAAKTVNILYPHTAATISATASREGHSASGTAGILLDISAEKIENMSTRHEKNKNVGIV